MGRFVTLVFAAATFALGALAAPVGPDGAGRSLPGKFVWLDLATENPDSARAFYGAVFGWKFRDVVGARTSYALASNGNAKVAGIFRQERPSGGRTGARWLTLMSVPDAQAAADVVRKRGGEVLLAPTTVRGRGTHAVFRDPEGAAFGVLTSEDGDPPDDAVEEGDVYWVDLFTTNPSSAARFYAELGHYEVREGETGGRTRRLLSTGNIARAGIALLPEGRDRPAWLPYILVANVAATLERARGAGGTVVLQPRPHLLAGKLAVIADREGALIGIVGAGTW